ncbi:MAG: class A beta-lactamase-related serine hydrolase [Planctomycetota bacterium]|nr:MAG: class A beta-lactamase-related serine hydrolase [Planctomycetota bacterium]
MRAHSGYGSDGAARDFGTVGRVRRSTWWWAWACIGVLTTCRGPLAAGEIPVVRPEQVGMRADLPQTVGSIMNELIERKKLAGGVVIIARHGKIAHWASYGRMDVEADKPMRKDAIFRIYSMTKAIVTAAALQLYDAGKLDLDAPVARYLPELKGVRVWDSGETRPPKTTLTVRDLMRHTSGFSYGRTGVDQIDRAFRRAKLLDRDVDLAEFTRRLADVPLLFDPGTDWKYGVSIDVLGRVVEVVSGQPLDVYLRKRIFEPLDMRDTAFFVPDEKLDRFTVNYRRTLRGGLTPLDRPETSRYRRKPKFLSGGGGLVSTARDYLRFLLAISQGGVLEGRRILKAETVRLMTTNQLPERVGWIKFGKQVREGVGFGLGFSVRVKPSRWDPDARIGEYGWGGAASTHYWVSPRDDLIVVTLEQVMPFSFATEFALKKPIYQAIVDGGTDASEK